MYKFLYKLEEIDFSLVNVLRCCMSPFCRKEYVPILGPNQNLVSGANPDIVQGHDLGLVQGHDKGLVKGPDASHGNKCLGEFERRTSVCESVMHALCLRS